MGIYFGKSAPAKILVLRPCYRGGNMVYYMPFVWLSGRSSMAELQPSKLATRVRFPSPAPRLDRPGWRNGSRDRLKICCTRVRAGSSPAPGTTAPANDATGGVSEWSMVQPWKGCVGASPPGVRIPPPPPTTFMRWRFSF